MNAIKKYGEMPPGTYVLDIGLDPEQMRVAIKRIGVQSIRVKTIKGVGFIVREGIFIPPTSFYLPEPRSKKKPEIEPIENYSIVGQADSRAYTGPIANPSGSPAERDAFYDGIYRRLRLRYQNL